MAKPDNVARFVHYMSVLRSGAGLNHASVSEGVTVCGHDVAPVKRRQFIDDIAYLKLLLPEWEPRASLETKGDGSYFLVRQQGTHKLAESEFLPFLKALITTTNLFPYGAEGWFDRLSQDYRLPSLEAFEGRILYASTPHPDKLKRDHFHSLVQSLVTQTRIEILYRNRNGEDRRAEFEPMAFLNHNGVWYLMGDAAFAHRREPLTQPTQLKLSRIRTCRPTAKAFENRFSVKEVMERLKSTYGSHLILSNLESPQTVTLRFMGLAAQNAGESWFHQGQKSVFQADGSCIMTLRVNNLFDALQLVSQWGTLAEPISPPELVDQWKDRARAMAAWTQQTTTTPQL